MIKLRLGIIGVGNIGVTHTKTILDGQVPDIILTAAADLLPDRRALAKELLGAEFPVFDDDEKLINSGLVDAVLIAVPHYQHPEIAIKSFKAGLHVLCEKPAGVYTKQVREMNEIAQKSGKVFAIMYNQRTNSCYRKMYELVKSGSFGSIMRTSWIITTWFRPECYYTSGGWRGTWDGEGGGVLLNQCPHQLDLYQWICGMPNRVHAFCHYGKWHNIETEDDVTAYFEYPNGATGTFVTSTGESPGTNRFEICFEKGKIVNDGGEDVTVYNLETNLREFNITAKDIFAAPKCTIEKPEIEKDNPQHAGIIRAFAAKILRGEPLIAEGYEGINGLTLSNAMHLSSWLKTTIKIPFDEDLYYDELKRKIEEAKKK
jgi:predicted dehydrogenase